MSTTTSGLPADRPETLADDLAGMGSFFIDPAGAAQRLFRKWFWLGPLILVSIVSSILIYTQLPFVPHIIELSPRSANLSPDQLQKTTDLAIKVQRFFLYLTPILTGLFMAVQAAILLGMCSVLAVNANFRSLFNLVAGCSLIQALAGLASIVVLRIKGEVSSRADLNPPLGLDIFLASDTNRYLAAVAGFFSLFQIWWLVMMVLILCAAFRISKGKAFAIVLPLLLLVLVFRLIGAISS